ncbi:PPE family protein [Mycobacterium paraterrae]|uniref:PPE family protein n=1 Tax=Mycobacterium paraterrae TaxID=577492 RepID=A0ABY3VXG3_9MYCO|nr:PPE family protein [Mycobacterium paraterrae]UMB72277.1 PPE family protein [Mycobacterium paraterrae]
MDFGALPPEINSARMYAGPGSSSFQVAASAWNGLAAELQSAAQGYETTITQLAGDEWNGPASAAMASAAQPYITWMQETAAQAEQAATQAQAAAAAFEQAFAATVAPPLVAANRAETAAAVQANVFGQYTPLIMQLEAQYAQMWAQDAAAMYGYAGQSAAAAKVTPFATPAATTNPGGTADQSAAVGQATATSAATSSQTILQELISLLPSNIQALLTPAGFQSAFGTPSSIEGTLFGYIFGTTVLPTSLAGLVTLYSPYASLFYNTEGLPYFSVGMGNFGVQIAKSAGILGGAAPAAAAPALKGLGGLGAGLGSGAAGAAGAGAHAVSAITGGAGTVGKLAVPASWIGGAPAAAPQGVQLVSHVTAAPEAAASGGGNLLGGMPLAGTRAGFGNGLGPRYGFKPTVMGRPPIGG